VNQFVTPIDPPTFTLSELQRHVGGMIEFIATRGDGLIMYADEEGLLKKRQPNFAASLWAGRLVVGDALILSKDEYRVD
jgi:hypothetical protein